LKKYLVFANGKLGLQVLQLLLDSSEIEVVGIIVNGQGKFDEEFVRSVNKCLSKRDARCDVFQYSENLWVQSEFLHSMRSADHAVSALFGHKIPSSVIDYFSNRIVNLHPSLLPSGKGADPVAWAIIGNYPQGATLHLVDSNIDTGKILMQTSVETDFSETAGQIYNKLIEALYNLFRDYLESNDRITIAPPLNSKSSYRTSKELNGIRLDLLKGNEQFEHVLRTIQALTYSDGRRAQIMLKSGEVWEVSINAKLISE
jgi:methionyl-tRNA formyltransferase